MLSFWKDRVISMSKQEIVDYFTSNSQSLNVKQTFVFMVFGLVIGLIICLTYFICSEKVVYSRRFNITLLITVLITDLIMLLISSNVVVSLGMVGALSIVRFRTAIKDSRDTIFIFWAIAEGLAVGTKSYKMTIVSVLFIAVVFIAVTFTAGITEKYLLIVTGDPDKLDTKNIDKILEDNKVKYRIRTLNSTAGRKECIYELKLKKVAKDELVEKIMTSCQVNSANLVVETGELVG